MDEIETVEKAAWDAARVEVRKAVVRAVAGPLATRISVPTSMIRRGTARAEMAADSANYE